MKLPIGVRIIAVLNGIIGAIYGIGTLGRLVSLDLNAFTIVSMIVAVSFFVLSYGMLSRKRWAWYGTIIASALIAGLSIYQNIGLGDNTALIRLVIAAAILYYLLSKSTQEYFTFETVSRRELNL
jgi:uncharacterized membrane protein (DUF2068 family)